MTLHLLKVHLQTFLSIPVTQKCQILSCDTLVANERYTNRTLAGKPEGKRPLRRPRGKWKDNITMDLIKTVFESVDWVHEGQDRDKGWAVANSVTKISRCTKYEEFLD